jgi:ankyrin repeat protein
MRLSPRVSVCACLAALSAACLIGFCLRHRPQPELSIWDAITSGDRERVHALILENPKAINERHWTLGGLPLHWAIKRQKTDIALDLLRHTADLDALDENRYTPLNGAIDWGNHEVVVALLDGGASPRGGGSLDPLHQAAFRGETRIARTLLERNPVDLDPCLMAGLGRLEELQDLVVNDPESVNAKTKFGTPLCYAAMNRQQEVVRFLLSKGADVTAEGPFGTPLHCAAYRGDVTSATMLLDAGSDVNAGAKWIARRTPLHCAADGGSVEVVIFLLQRGADPDVEDEAGQTPLRLALGRNTEAVLRDASRR